MNIAMTSLYLPGGSKIGVGYQVHQMANQMILRGHRVTVFSQNEAGENPLYQLVRVMPKKRFSTFGFAWDLRQFDFSKFDVLHAHGDDWFLWNKHRPRHIHTYHGSCFAEFQHQTTLREKLRMLGLAACEYGSTYLCDEGVAVSENSRRILSSVKHVIPNGVDLDRFYPGVNKSDEPSILFVGTLRGRKRGEVLLNTFSDHILKERPDAQLWAVCEEPVSGPNIQWFGRVPEDVLCELYRRAWVFCLPSTYEGFGVPYIEAMASGTAVVATPNQGALEVLKGGKFGLIVQEKRLGHGVLQVLKDTSLRQFLERGGVKEVRRYDWGRVCSAYEKLYVGRKKQLASITGAGVFS
jgi:glycosyltransferase involved in cell wall biosynthesis